MWVQTVKGWCAAGRRMMGRWLTWAGLLALLFALGPADPVTDLLRDKITLATAWANTQANWAGMLASPWFRVIALIFAMAFFGMAAKRAADEHKEMEHLRASTKEAWGFEARLAERHEEFENAVKALQEKQTADLAFAKEDYQREIGRLRSEIQDELNMVQTVRQTYNEARNKFDGQVTAQDQRIAKLTERQNMLEESVPTKIRHAHEAIEASIGTKVAKKAHEAVGHALRQRGLKNGEES